MDITMSRYYGSEGDIPRGVGVVLVGSGGHVAFTRTRATEHRAVGRGIDM